MLLFGLVRGGAARRDLPRSTAAARNSFGNRFPGIVKILAAGACIRRVGDLQFRRGTPQPLQVVEPTRRLAENVDNKAPEIQQHPVRRAAPFAVLRGTLKMLVYLLFHFAANGLHLGGAETGANDEVRGKRSGGLQVQHANPCGFLVLCRLHGQAHSFGQSVVVHRYRPCFRMYSSTRADTSPWIDCPRWAFRRMSVALASFATFSSRYTVLRCRRATT